MNRPAATPQYVLGRSEAENRRLVDQSDLLQPLTEHIFRTAGIGPGMRVLDLGCGMGDVSFVAASLVGPTGSVTGIDRNPDAVEVARGRARQLGLSSVSFEVHPIETYNPAEPYDAAVGRLVLVYQADPSATLARLSGLVRDEGFLIFQEPDLSIGLRAWPPVRLLEQASDWIRETFRRAGVHYDLGMRLYSVFRGAGLPSPTIRYNILAGGGPDIRPVLEHCAGMVRSLLPKMEEFEIANPDEVGIDSLAERLVRDVTASDSQVTSVPLVSAWARKS
jgi:SAM-dependent methyltransferase